MAAVVSDETRRLDGLGAVVFLATFAGIAYFVQSRTVAEARDVEITPVTAVAEAETRLDAARLLLRDAYSQMWEACASGAPDNALRATAWRAVSHAAAAAKEVVTRMFETGGTSALYTDSLLERCNRDIWTVAQHIVLSPMWREQAGRVRLGLSPTQPLF